MTVRPATRRNTANRQVCRSRVYAAGMSDAKTKPTSISVDEFLETVTDPQRRADAAAACTLFRGATGAEPVMWGPSIIGFGAYTYRYASGRSGEAPAVGLSPRRANLTIYVSAGFDGYGDLLDRLGRHSTGKGCLYLDKLSDADPEVLRTLVRRAFADRNGRELTPE